MADVSTLINTVDEVSILRKNSCKLVMDKGFYSKKNIDYLIKSDKINDFLIAVTFRVIFAKQSLNNQIDLCKRENLIPTGSDIIYGNTEIVKWDNNTNLYKYCFYNNELHSKAYFALLKIVFKLIHILKEKK
jgi:transposase